MRILYLTESMRWSGGAEQLLAMAQALRARGHEVVLGCQPGSDVRVRAEAQHLPVVLIRMRQDYDLPAAWRVARVLQEQKIDLLHAQHSTAHALGLMAALWSKVPAFAVTRRVMFPLRRNLFSRLKYKSRRINGYIAIAEAVKREMVRGGIDPSRITVIPSVIHRSPLSREEGKALRHELRIPEGCPLILNVANYADFKGQDVLLAAAVEVLKQRSQVRFVLVGRDTDRLQSLVDRLGIAAEVVLAGFRTDIPRFLAAADVFVLSSLKEGAATALREAMAAGLPVIGSRTGGIPESIIHEKTGLLVSPGDSWELAAAIRRVLEDPAGAKNMAERGRSWVQEQFSLERAADKMEHFYQKLLNGHGKLS